LFNVASAFPAGFVFRDTDVDRTVNVAALPSGLQQYIEAHQDKNAPRDDIVLMLSQDCLQYIKTRFLGPRAGKDRAEAAVAKDKQAAMMANRLPALTAKPRPI